jgi:antitoxin CptB
VDARGIERFKWRSRRGLLELDLVFQRYWPRVGETMTDTEAGALERLLAMPDNDLLDLVMGRTALPDDGALRELVTKLQAA